MSFEQELLGRNNAIVNRALKGNATPGMNIREVGLARCVNVKMHSVAGHTR